MGNYYASSGLARAAQAIDSTCQYIVGNEVYGTSASQPFNSYVLDEYGSQIPIETTKGKLGAIRRRSQSELGEAWSKLAQM